MDVTNTQNLGHIEKLVGRENYSSWKFAMQAYLECDDLWGCITGEATYLADQKKMNKAKAKIILSMDKQNYSHIQDTVTPKDAWEKLESVFEDSGLTRKVVLLRTLTSTKLVDCRSVEEYVNRITNTAHKLKEADLEVKDEMVGALLLSGLPEEYKPMIMALESSGTPITMDAMKVKLLQGIKGDKGLSTQNSETAFIPRQTKEEQRRKIRRKNATIGENQVISQQNAEIKQRRDEAVEKAHPMGYSPQHWNHAS